MIPRSLTRQPSFLVRPHKSPTKGGKHTNSSSSPSPIKRLNSFKSKGDMTATMNTMKSIKGNPNVYQTVEIKIEAGGSGFEVAQTVDLIKHLLYAYEDAAHKKVNLLNAFNMNKIKMFAYETITQIRPEMIYLLVSLMPSEIHEFFINFYARFDENKNFMIDQHEFNSIMDTMAGEKMMGEKKFKVIIDLLLQDETLYSAGEKSPEENVDQHTLQLLWDRMMDPSTQQGNSRAVVDYWMFFPFLLSFFFESFLREVHNRYMSFDLVKGIEMVDNREMEIKNIFSLNQVLKEMGIDYLKRKNDRVLSYRDIETILLRYKNVNRWMTFDHVKEILKAFEKKMRVEFRTKIEGKRMLLHKAIDLLALKICIHHDCTLRKSNFSSSGPAEYLEILMHWNCVFKGAIMGMQGAVLQENFLLFMQKWFPNDNEFTRIECTKVLERYFRKHFPLMSKDSVKKIVKCHEVFDDANLIQNPKIPLDVLSSSLFEMLCAFGYDKLSEYVEATREGIKKRKTVQDAYAHKHQRSQGDEPKESGRERQVQESPEDVFEDQSPDNVVHQEPDDEADQATPLQSNVMKVQARTDLSSKQKFKKMVLAVQSEQNFSHNLEKKPPKDLLKACLIMENFLERYVHANKKDIKTSQKARHYLEDQMERQDDRDFSASNFIPSIRPSLVQPQEKTSSDSNVPMRDSVKLPSRQKSLRKLQIQPPPSAQEIKPIMEEDVAPEVKKAPKDVKEVLLNVQGQQTAKTNFKILEEQKKQELQQQAKQLNLQEQVRHHKEEIHVKMMLMTALHPDATPLQHPVTPGPGPTSAKNTTRPPVVHPHYEKLIHFDINEENLKFEMQREKQERKQQAKGGCAIF